MKITRSRTKIWASAVVALATASIAQAEPLTIAGPARVIDGDTVVIQNGLISPFSDGIHVRLKGVDAAELGTELGEASRRAMIAIVAGAGGDLKCFLTGEKTWRREVGFCFTSDGTDINQAIIAQGFALACPRYSDRYVQFEQASAIAAQQRAHYCIGRQR